MNYQEFRVGLVGLGTVANFHIAALYKIRGVRLVAGCDPATARRDYMRQRWKLGNVYASLDELHDKERLDAVHVLTPPPSHVSVALECLKRNWHCLIEKPLVLDVSDGELLARAARQNDRTVGVNHNKIWNPAFRKLTRLIDKGELGEIRHVNVEHAVQQPFRTGDWSFEHLSFPIFETAPHTFSIISGLLGSIQETQDRICEVMKLGERQYVSGWQSTLQCDKGNAFAFVSLNGSLPCCTVSVVGSKGAARADLLANTLFQSRQFGRFEPYERVFRTGLDGISLLKQSLAAGIAHAAQRIGYAGFGDPFLESMRESIGEFYQALRESREPKANLKAGLEAVQACEMVAGSFRPIS
jgi:predicted dehydrogenase